MPWWRDFPEWTEDERTALAHLERYLAELAEHGLTPEDALELERLVHDPLPPFFGVERGEPGPLLADLTPEERERFREASAQYYAATSSPEDKRHAWAALAPFYTREATSTQRAAIRAARGWAAVPTLQEWLEGKGPVPALAPRASGQSKLFLDAVFHTGPHDTPKPRLESAGMGYWVYDRSHSILTPDTVDALLRRVEDAEARAAEAERQLEEERRRKLPVLRLGSRTLRTHSATRSDFHKAVRALRQRGTISAQRKKELSQFLDGEELVPLRGDELLVVAGLLEVARQEGKLRGFDAAKVKLGNLSFDFRLSVPEPRLEEFGRLVGFQPTASGTLSGNDRQRLASALAHLTTPRPILVPYRERVGDTYRDGYDLIESEVPVRRVIGPDGTSALELHASLAHGYYHGHIKFQGLPRQWEDAKRAIGAQRLDEVMKWADFYFMRLRLGVAMEYQDREPPPEGLLKRLALANLLEQFDLTAYRKKKGPKDTRLRMGKVLDFCRETGRLLSWKWDGAGHVLVWLPPLDPSEPEPLEGGQQEDLFQLGAGAG